tara:strand:- start:1001 stop:1600 length:600 start_codon:yes stop_codon:yes gene_type:complete
MNYDFLYKIIVIGDQYVGKTSILNKINNIDHKCLTTTIGVDFSSKIIIFDDKKIAKVRIWDTAGHERFNTITSNYYRNADAIILCFDVTNKNTFYNLETWLNSIKEKNDNKLMPILIVGNKNDIKNNFDLNELKQLCKKINSKYLLVSSYNDTSNYLFKNIILNLCLEIRNNNYNAKEYSVEDIECNKKYRNNYNCCYM